MGPVEEAFGEHTETPAGHDCSVLRTGWDPQIGRGHARGYRTGALVRQSDDPRLTRARQHPGRGRGLADTWVES